jgi:indole-3-glycerol phosphate synthase
MHGLLQEIFTQKRDEIERNRRRVSMPDLEEEARHAAPAMDFLAAIRPESKPASASASGRQKSPALIAEVKRSSPSRGVLARDFDPLRLARAYHENGAAAISVLTDEPYFGGSLEHLRQIASCSPRIPLLRKDFICDPYQVYEARAAGADALLLIVAGLSIGILRELHHLTLELGMAPLVEVHTRQELETALAIKPALLGINNRDLHDFTVRLETTEALCPHVPSEVGVVAESGIHTAADVQRLSQAGVDAVLVGEALVGSRDIGAKVRELAGK